MNSHARIIAVSQPALCPKINKGEVSIHVTLIERSLAWGATRQFNRREGG
jgi:hypothetical protein